MTENARLKFFRFEGLLQREDWLTPAYVGVDEGGLIRYLSNRPVQGGSAIEAVQGYALPGFQNAHSHAFQYAMVGRAENHPAGRDDDFWTWREEMYKTALSVGPEEMEAIAAMLYTQMLRHGYTHVAEFHYLHHDKEGKPYGHLAEMGERMIAAAKTAGIKITLVPVFYQKGGFGLDPQPRQRRFISRTIDDYFKLLEASKAAVRNYVDAKLGLSAHSLRAVKLEDVVKAFAQGPKDLPFHMHVAEQKKEIADCLAYCGKRPLQWLSENLPLGPQFHLVHCTHLDDEELKTLASSKSNVVLCPSTEGNLGDGIFRMKEYQSLGGKWSIGTDSHIGLNPYEELRMVDYRQRLTTHRRNTFQGDGAKYMIHEVIENGRNAMGFNKKDHFEIGEPLDSVIIDAKSSLIATASLANILATLIYSGDVSCNYGTLVNGQWKVKQQLHQDSQHIRQKFVSAMKNLTETGA